MENNELVNIYLQKLVNEVIELTKFKLLIEARLQYTENYNQQLLKQIEDLEASIEKHNKKINKKEVNTSENTF